MNIFKAEKDKLVKDYDNKLNELQDSGRQARDRIDELTELKKVIESERISVIREKDKLSSEVTELKQQLTQSRHSNESTTFIHNQFESYRQKFEDAKDNIFTLT